jgi:glucosylceramidase
MRNIILNILSILLIGISVNAQTKVFYVELNKDKEIPALPILEYKQQKEHKLGEKIVIYPDIEFQEISGIGGAFNEIGGLALMTLSEESKEGVMSNLFSKDNAQFSFCRTAIGASDFGTNAYSYSEISNDYEMKYFSIKREEKSVIPYIKLAEKYNPDLKLFASPWSPPGWMKYSGLMDNGKDDPSKNKLKDEPKIYKAYATYFSKYVKAYQKEGITVDKILIQNETDISTKYPSCDMDPNQMYKFVSTYLRPEFDKENIETEIWAGTFRTHGVLDALEFTANEKYLNSVDGIGIQYTNSRYINDINLLAKNKPTMHTEGICYNGSNSIEQAFKRLEEVASYINYGIPNYCYWNMILDETGNSGWNWKQNSLINIDREKHTVTYNPDYSVIALLSKYMQPGVKRVASFSKETLISVKKGNTLFLFVQNKSDKEKNYSCIEKGETVASATIPAKSVAVIIYESNML